MSLLFGWEDEPASALPQAEKMQPEQEQQPQPLLQQEQQPRHTFRPPSGESVRRRRLSQ